MTQKPELIIQATLAVATTVALGVASVWLSGDSRVTGLVVMVAGIAMLGVIGYKELRATPRHQPKRQDVEDTEVTSRAAKAA